MARPGRPAMNTSRFLTLPPVADQTRRLADLKAWPWRVLTIAERRERERFELAASARAKMSKRQARL